MEAEYIKYLWLALITLAQIVLVGVKIIEKRNNKKNNKEEEQSGNPGNYGERIAKLEEAVGFMKDDIKKIDEKLERMRRPGK